MKEDRFEKFVIDNRQEFDHLNPSPEVWGKLNLRLKKQHNRRKKLIWLNVAAVVAIVLIGSGVFVSEFISPSQQIKFAEEADPELRELIEAEVYYARQVDGKMKEIRKCYQLVPELQMEVENDLLELEKMYNMLRADLKDNISNKEVIEAMIENNRYRMKLVDDVLRQIKC